MAKNQIQAPQPSATEQALQSQTLSLLQNQSNLTQQLLPITLEAMGLVSENGQIRPMTEEEMIAGMTPAELQSYQLQNLTGETLLKALNGELEVSPALEADLAKQEKMMTEKLAQSLGPNWQNSTVGQQAMSEFQRKADINREEARRGYIGTLSGIYSGMQGNTSALNQQTVSNSTGIPSATFGGLFSNISQAQQPYQFYAGLTQDANKFNAQMRQAQLSGLMSGLGSLTGAGLGYLGAGQAYPKTYSI